MFVAVLRACCVVLMLSACVTVPPPIPKQNVYNLDKKTAPLVSKDYGILVAKTTGDQGGVSYITFKPYDRASNKFIPINEDPNIKTADLPLQKGDRSFRFEPTDDGYQVIALKPGYYVIERILLGDFSATGGVHPVTHKPLYGGFEIQAGELLYIGDIHLTTDRLGYKNPKMISEQQSPLGMLIGVVVYAATHTFTDDDFALGVVNDTAAAKNHVATNIPMMMRPLVYRPLTLGYYAHQNHGSNSKEKF